VGTAFAVLHETACGLKSPNGGHRVSVVDPGFAGRRKAGRGEAAVEVTDRASFIARTQR
jgi:hypothetical protein